MQIPRSSDDITPAWLTAALRGSGTITVASVETVTVEDIGEAQGLGEGVKRISVTYDRPVDAGPLSLVAKLAPQDDRKRQIINGLGLFEREVRFYQELATDSGISTPRCYFAGYDPDSWYFTLLLEDLSYLREVDQAAECSLEDASTSLRALATLHAKWWGSETLEKLPWLIDPADPQTASQAQDRYVRNLEPFIALTGSHLSPGVESIVRKLGPNLASVMAATCHRPVTLNHGDFRLGNLFFDDVENSANPVVAFDWPAVCRRRAAGDVAYFVCWSFATDGRRKHENQLLADYHTRLIDHGIRNYSYDEFLTDFRIGLLRNLTSFVPGVVEMGGEVMSSEQGRQRVFAMCERFETLVDWDCEAVILR